MRLVLIGDGEARGELERFAEETSVVFKGQQGKEHVIEEMTQAKGIVAPSVYWETFGLTSVEAQSAGTPSVVSDLGALRILSKRVRRGLSSSMVMRRRVRRRFGRCCHLMMNRLIGWRRRRGSVC